MKIREGFVSNSSSSSFIVPYNRNFRYKKKLQLAVFGFDSKFTYNDDEYSIDEILNKLHGDLTTTKKAGKKEIIEELASRYSSYDFSDLNKNSYSWNYKEEERFKYVDKVLKEEFHKLCVEHDTFSTEYYAKRRKYDDLVPEEFNDDYDIRRKWLYENTDYKEFEAIHTKKLHETWAQETNARMKIAKADFAALTKKHKRFVLLSYSDNDSMLDATLEHAGLVEKLSNDVIRISHH